MSSVGIYKITCSKSLRVYIGSSKNILYRISTHLYELRRGTHHSSILQKTFNKYGELTFNFEIIEECDEKILLEREQFYLNSLLFAQEYLSGESRDFEKVAFNILPIAGSSKGLKREFKIGRKKIKTYIKSEAHKKAISDTLKLRNKLFGSTSTGVPKSIECRQKISDTMKNKYKNGLKNNFLGKSHSEASKQKNREKHVGKIPINSKEVVVFNIETKEVLEIKTTTLAAKQFNTKSIHYLIASRKVYDSNVFFYKNEFNQSEIDKILLKPLFYSPKIENICGQIVN